MKDEGCSDQGFRSGFRIQNSLASLHLVSCIFASCIYVSDSLIPKLNKDNLMLHSEYDVIVVGAGPGGSIAAKVAAENGLSVLLLEKRQEIGAPVR